MGHCRVESDYLYDELAESMTRPRRQRLHKVDCEVLDVLAILCKVFDDRGGQGRTRLVEVAEGQLLKALLTNVLILRKHLEHLICDERARV